MLKIIVTGPESSGKTTLCKEISNQFNIPFTTEYAREYLKTKGVNYNQSDLLEIAKGQFISEGGLNQQLSLQDTDLITIKIWSEYKYGNCDNWILDQIEKQKSENRFYLLCRADITWEDDPLRENPDSRGELFEIYKKELEHLGHNYLIVEGEKRMEKSLKKICQIKSES